MFESLQATADEIAQAIANTASHELGHLLGLEHAADPNDIMSTAATARQILETDASIQRSALDPQVFPAGWQNGQATIRANVGGKAGVAGRLIIPEAASVVGKADVSWREKFDFAVPTCGHCEQCVGSGN